MADVPRYRFGPLERRGVLMGLRAGQLGVVGTAIVVAVVALSSAPSASGLGLAALVGASRGRGRVRAPGGTHARAVDPAGDPLARARGASPEKGDDDAAGSGSARDSQSRGATGMASGTQGHRAARGPEPGGRHRRAQGPLLGHLHRGAVGAGQDLLAARQPRQGAPPRELGRDPRERGARGRVGPSSPVARAHGPGSGHRARRPPRGARRDRRPFCRVLSRAARGRRSRDPAPRGPGRAAASARHAPSVTSSPRAAATREPARCCGASSRLSPRASAARS